MPEPSQPAIRTPSLRRQRLVLWLAFVIILFVSGLAFWSTQQLIGAGKKVEASQAELIEINRFLSDLKDVETGGRGYVISDDVRHLQRFQHGAAASEATARRLRQLSSNDPQLRQALDRLFSKSKERIASSRKLIDERHDRSATRSNLVDGLVLMDQIRNEVASILSAQQQKYHEQRRRLERQAWITSISLAAGVVLCLGIIGWLFTLRGRELERRRQLEEALRGLNLELEDRVQERTLQLRQSEERAGLIIDAALDAVITIDDAGRLTGWNPQAEKIFGWTRDEVLGRLVDETIMPERYREPHRTGLARYLETGEERVLNKRIELVAIHRNGEEFPVELAITPIRGKNAVSFSAFIRDVSEAKERIAQLKRASDLLNAVVENMPDMILLKEPTGDSFRYLLINAAGEKLIGRDRSEVIGRTAGELFPPDETAQIVEANQAVAESGKPHIFTDRKLTSATGMRTVETRMVPIADSSGRTALIMAIVRDISEARAREDQIRQLQRMDAVGKLTGGVAHDFNNLLAIIHGNSELMRDRIHDDPDLAEMVDDVLGASARGAELVRRLLAFARMQHLESEPIDLNARLPNILSLLQRSLGERIDVRVKQAKKLWQANLDPTQVDDALVNLAINARDAMPEGGSLTIETQNITLDEDYAAHHVEVSPGDYVMLAVSDTGTGMPPDVIARAFEPFFTTKPEGQGTGLGLSQVFGWIKQSGGHIKIYSEVGHGTTIKLYLPRAKESRADEAPQVEAVEPGGNETIFVVEDNPKVRKTVVRQLRDLGYDTIEAGSGAAALQLVRDGARFDLLLTDIVMPGGITGYQLADELRLERPTMKVLFTSGYTELAASTNGATRHDPLLSKPYRKQDLSRAVRTALDDVNAAPASS
jgi:PAS domain S-box-containing protein